jgi:hypothetical protein
LAGSEDFQSAHLAEALQYRPKLMLGWEDNRLQSRSPRINMKDDLWIDCIQV